MSVEELLSKLPNDLRIKATSFAIYGQDANQMLLTTRDDELFAIAGFNVDPMLSASAALNCLVAPNLSTSITPGSTCYSTKIDILCGKGICELAHSPNPNNNRYVLLRTSNGELYSFGDCHQDDSAILMSPICAAVTTTKRRSTNIFTASCTLFSAHPLLQDKKIIQISCGFNHAACLTSYGEVFVWNITPPSSARSRVASPSRHQNSSIDNTNQQQTTLPTSSSKLTLYGCIAKRRSPIIEIGSYQEVIVGLDEDGRIHEWQFSELGLPYGKVVELTSDENMLNCRLLASDSIRDVRIVHISSGRSHCLAISNSFAVYAWGNNDSGQLGLGLSSSIVSSPSSLTNSPLPGRSQNGNFVGSPSRLPFFDEQPAGPMKKIKAIGTHSHLDISIAEAVTGDIYVWGELAVSGFSACTSRPTWTRCRSIIEALQSYGRLAFTPATLFIPVPCPTLTRSLLEAFDNSDHADVQFITPGYPPIYAHKQFLQLRAPRFLTTFGSKGWHQGRAVLISVDHISYGVIKAFMRFLYTNEFHGIDKQGGELDCDDFISLAELAEMCEETLLRKLVCNHIVSNCLTIENAAFIYSSVLKKPNLDKENSLPAACLSFILANLVDVVRSETFAALDGDIAKRILVEAASVNKASAIKK